MAEPDLRPPETGEPHRRGPVPNQHFGYKQDRSLKTFERLVDAAQQLLSDGDSFETLSVIEVCERAGLSVGAFYRRFESREGLIACLHERYVERVSALQAHLLDPARWEQHSLKAMVEGVIDEAFSMTGREVNLVRAIEVHAQSDPIFAAREREMHAQYLELMTRLLLRRVDAIGHPRPRRAAQYCAYQIRSVLYYSFVTSGILGNGHGTPLKENQIAGELKDSVCAYLRVEE